MSAISTSLAQDQNGNQTQLNSYSFPINQLLTFADCRELPGWPDFL